MTLKVEDILKKLDRIRLIVDRIEDGVPIETHLPDVAELLDEYAMILRNSKVNI